MKSSFFTKSRTSMGFWLILVVFVFASCSERNSQPEQDGESPASQVHTEKTGDVSAPELSQEQFNDLVDYVNCYYVDKYLRKNKFQGSSCAPKSFGEQKNVEELKGFVQGQKTAISKNIKEEVTVLIDSINSKKKSYGKVHTKDEMVALLTRLSDYAPKAEPRKYSGIENDTLLQKQLSDCLSDFSQPVTSKKTIDEESAKENQTKNVRISRSQVDTASTDNAADESGEDKSSTAKNDNSLWWLFLIIGVVAGAAGVIGWRKLFVGSDPHHSSKSDKTFQQILKKDNHELQQKLEKYQDENRQLESKYRRMKQERDDYWRENIDLGEQIEDLKSKIVRRDVQPAEQEPEAERIPLTTPSPAFSDGSILYANAIIDETLIGVSDTPGDDTCFQLNLTDASTATLTVHPAAAQRIIANPAFLEGCDKQVLANASTMKVEETGVAKKRSDNGKWEVVTKLKVVIQ